MRVVVLGILFPCIAMVEETVKALRIRLSERRVAEALVAKLFGLSRAVRLRRKRKTASTRVGK